jgi:hypothetical protein
LPPSYFRKISSVALQIFADLKIAYDVKQVVRPEALVNRKVISQLEKIIAALSSE